MHIRKTILALVGFAEPSATDIDESLRSCAANRTDQAIRAPRRHSLVAPFHSIREGAVPLPCPHLLRVAALGLQSLL